MAKDDNRPAQDPAIAERLAQLDKLIEEQRARLDQAQGQVATGGITADQLAQVLATANAAQREIAEQSRQVRHSNPDHLHISAFSYPEGDLKRPKPKLRLETYLNNHREREDDLTPAEIDAYNAITHSCTAREERGEEGMWKAVVDVRRLRVRIPAYTQDERQEMHNGLVLNLRELAQGKRAADPLEMAARLAALEKAAEAAGITIPA